MSTPSAQDYRRASEAVLLDGLRDRHPLALAEAYHRVVPAAHAVARRLVTDASEVEDVLMQVFGQLWSEPPEDDPLEGWARRATWAAGAARLRASGRSPASPSASLLLPDLPAPDVRFLDASERAIGELADEERRALLLAHDKGVPTSAQDPGADTALVRALVTLAGPESSAGDRDALDGDGCTDVVGLGDWCLGIADQAYVRSVEDAIEERTGCAARSRAVRRGRRRIEGLPATPDMGHRVLVSVLTGAAAGPPTAAPVVVTTADAPVDRPEELSDQASEAAEQPESTELDVAMTAAGAGAMSLAAEDDAFIGNTAELQRVGDGSDDVEVSDDDMDDDDPFAELAALGDEAPADAELSAAAESPPSEPFGAPDDEVNWAPNPGDTAELSLSDILAEDDEEDPFAALDEPLGASEPAPVTGGSPYAALNDLDGAGDDQPSPFAQGGTGPLDAATPVVSGQGPLGTPEEVYVEGQDVALEEPAPAGGGFAAVLAWILPVLGGLAVGVLLAMQVFG